MRPISVLLVMLASLLAATFSAGAAAQDLGRLFFTPEQRAAGQVTIPDSEGAQRYNLRVGESLDRGSGEVRDVIGEGEIRVGPRRPAPRK